MRSTLRAVAGLFLILLATACIVETEATLGEADPKTFDQRLVGNWYAGKGGDAVILSIIRDEQTPGGYRAVLVNINAFADGAVEGARYAAACIVLNGQSYLSIRRISGAKTDMPGTTVVSYDLREDGTLVLRMMQPKDVIAAIEAGKIKGTFKKGQYVDEAKITSPRAELAAFIAGADREKLFGLTTDPLHRLPETAK
jgi:hypothetical protein